jgi:hypothetical protein
MDPEARLEIKATAFAKKQRSLLGRVSRSTMLLQGGDRHPA